MPETTDAPVAFDSEKFRQLTRAQWEAAAEAWDRWAPLLARWLGPATEAMLDMAAVGPGARVLDVAAGAGEQTLAAARRVGPKGYVLATDISPAILRFALRAARQAGLTQVETLELDGERHDTLARSVLRRGHFAGRPDLLSRSAAGACRHPQGTQARRAFCRGRLFDPREESVLLPARGHHSPPRAVAAAVAWTTGAIFAGRRAACSPAHWSRRGSATSKCAGSTRRCGCRRPRSAHASSASPSARCTR